MHYTPKHGSWLDLAESELNRRIPNKQILVDELAAWEHDRNANHTRPTAITTKLRERAHRSVLEFTP